MPLQPQRQQHFLHLAAEGAGVAEEQVLRHLLGEGRAALHHTAGAQIDPGGAQHADRVDAGMRPEPPVLHRDHRRRQVGRQVAPAAAARRPRRRRSRTRGRRGPAASGWGGGRRPAPIPGAAGRGRTTAAPRRAASAPQTPPIRPQRSSRQRQRGGAGAACRPAVGGSAPAPAARGCAVAVIGRRAVHRAYPLPRRAAASPRPRACRRRSGCAVWRALPRSAHAGPVCRRHRRTRRRVPPRRPRRRSAGRRATCRPTSRRTNWPACSPARISC